MIYSPVHILGAILETANLGRNPMQVPETPPVVSPWPLFYNYVSTQVKEQVSLFDTTGTVGSRSMRTGTGFTKHGVQLRVEGPNPTTALDLCTRILESLTPTNLTQVTLSLTSYTVHSIVNTTTVIRLGRKPPEYDVHVFTCNFLVTLNRV